MRPVPLAAALFLAIAGCSSKLETGYEYTKLDTSIAHQHALYAEPFSKEAEAAGQENNSKASQSQIHTPGQQ